MGLNVLIPTLIGGLIGCIGPVDIGWLGGGPEGTVTLTKGREETGKGKGKGAKGLGLEVGELEVEGRETDMDTLFVGFGVELIK